jgi:cytoskeleton protein RodZ
MATGKTKASSTVRNRMNAPKSPSSAQAASPAPLLGPTLREAREARELSLDTVADELMIRRYYLESLEDGQYRQLPERVYAVGFVQNYAQLLGLDAATLVEQFKREAYGGRGAAAARMELSMPAPPSQNLLPNKSTLFVIGGLLVLILVGGIVWNTRSPHSAETQIPQPPAVATNDMAINSVSSSDAPPAPAAPVPDKTAIVSSAGTVTTANPPMGAADIAAPEPAAPDFVSATPPAQASAAVPAAETPATPATPPAAAAVAPKGTRILIEALQPSWVEIADADGNILFTNILRLGQALPIPDKAGITLTTGNAAGVQIILDGKKLGALGRTGEVKRAIALDPSKLSTAAPR